jgi:L-ascorbate metabolism protein UlaG (beta-lactamase superfamily)
VQPPALDFDSLPRIDAVWLSHDHYDHCDLPTLRRIAREHPRARLFTPLGHEDVARRAGFGPSRHTALDWWEHIDLASGFRLTATPARHWGNRLSGRRNQRLWGGWHLAAPDAALFFSGDTAFDAEMFSAVRRELGAPDLALLPIGAYAPRWFMREQHCDPEEAVAIFRLLGARRAMGMHWGAFPFTDEPREEPPARLADAARSAGLAPDRFAAPPPGGTLSAIRGADSGG